MKKFFLLCSLAAAIYACTPKASPVATPSAETKTTVTDNATTTTSSAHVGSLKAGETVYISKCGKCHALKSVANYTATQWDGILKIMAPKAKLSETETANVTAYVKAGAKSAQP